jgi:hypothetical protein
MSGDMMVDETNPWDPPVEFLIKSSNIRKSTFVKRLRRGGKMDEYYIRRVI